MSRWALVAALALGLAACRGADESASRLDADSASSEGGSPVAGHTAAGLPAAIAELAQLLDAEPLTLVRHAPPERDLAGLAVRLGRTAPEPQGSAPRVAAETPVARSVGDREDFWVHDIVGNRYFEVTAELEVITDAAYFWVQVDQPFEAEGLARGAEAFSTEIYPELRRVFGSEWSPGVDGDPRVHVLHHEPIPGVAGFFSSADAYTATVDSYSNEREMFYINLSTYAPGSSDYLQLLAHEYQHMIHWHRDRGEPVWVNEGLSELAPYLVGHGRQTGADLIAQPDLQLTRWEDGGSNGGHYAASFLFFAWLWGQHGEPWLEALLAAEGNGEAGVEEALAAIGHPAAFAEVFMDWTVANLIGDTRVGEGRFGYDRVSVRKVNPRALPRLGADSTVHQFGADYWNVTELVEDGRLALTFEGAPTVDLLAPADPDVGHVWWSNRGDDMDSRLTRRFDLRGVEQATLTFRSWWAIEEHWDHGYVMASTDDGASWEILPSAFTTTADPNGNSFGPARTGASGSWVTEEVDLGAYAGIEVLLRFELVTDDAVSLAGWGIDDLAIPAIGYLEDLEGPAEREGAPWHAEGWLPLDPALPQRWGLRTVLRSRSAGGDGPRIVDHPVTPSQGGALLLEEVPEDATVTLIVSGLTHATRNVAAYRLWSPAEGTPPAGYP